jgi:glucokinase
VQTHFGSRTYAALVHADQDHDRDRRSAMGTGQPVLAFDIGGTDIKSALIDDTGRMLGLHRMPTPHHGAETATAIVEQLGLRAKALSTAFPTVVPTAAGVVAPGLVDDERGIAIRATNLDWRDVPFRDRAEARLGVPVSFSHDVRAAGEAEYRLGAARPYRDVIVIVIGTGIAGAIILDGRVHVAGGYAGEIGHAVVDPFGEPCPCGARGCLETLGSAGAIARRYEAMTGTRPLGARDVLDRAGSGDPSARGVWDDAVAAISLSIAQLAAVLAPEAVVIGGGLAQAGDALFTPLRKHVDTLLSFHRSPVIVPALIGEDAGLVGAGLRARRLCDDATRPSSAFGGITACTR